MIIHIQVTEKIQGYRIKLFSLILVLTMLGCHSEHHKNIEVSQPLFDHLGGHHFPVSTSNPLAQKYFDQGLILSYGFNHAEAARSFEAAYQLDPECAMCYWGAALVLGPNINAPMDPSVADQAYSLVQKAQTLASAASAKEQALILALTKRYTQTSGSDRQLLDQAYADAMAEVAGQYTDDALINALYAEALMDLHPWDFWTKQGIAMPWTEEIIATLEHALAEDQHNPLANHLYIHMLEASPNPEKALVNAQRLPKLVPGSGHLVHMPAHIYIRLGLYRDTILANQQAVGVDQGYLSHNHTESLYTLAYVPHNHHFLWAAAIRTGRQQLAMQAALETAAAIDAEMLRTPGVSGTLQHFYTIPLYTQALFGEWDAILAAPAPEPDLVYPTAIWHYARGLAFLRLGQQEQANQELKKLKVNIKDPAIANLTVFDLNPVALLMQLAADILQAELALSHQQYDIAVASLEHAIELEDGLNYTEPKDWYLPPRQVLGVVLLAQGKAEKAEQVYRQDLLYHPQNGWSLYGLMQSLQAQGKSTEAKAVQKQFQTVWAEADVTLKGSRF